MRGVVVFMPACDANDPVSILSEGMTFFLNFTLLNTNVVADLSFLLQFDLICNVSALSVLNKAVMFLGFMIGVLVGGFLSDKFGRKPVLYVLSVLCSFIALGASFVQVHWLYVLLRCLVGVCIGK